jgi:hypothetical protein
MRLCVRRGTICCTQGHDNLCTCEQFTVEYLTDYTDCSLREVEPSVIVSPHQMDTPTQESSACSCAEHVVTCFGLRGRTCFLDAGRAFHRRPYNGRSTLR